MDKVVRKNPKISELLSQWLKYCEYNLTMVAPRDLNFRYYLLSKVIY